VPPGKTLTPAKPKWRPRQLQPLDTGLNESQLCKFMKGDTGLNLESLAILANYLDVEIIIRPRPRSKTDGKHKSR
jgi:hypothetical protein